jgi:hypothetical protein
LIRRRYKRLRVAEEEPNSAESRLERIWFWRGKENSGCDEKEREMQM